MNKTLLLPQFLFFCEIFHTLNIGLTDWDLTCIIIFGEPKKEALAQRPKNYKEGIDFFSLNKLNASETKTWTPNNSPGI
jgi:hypothetical protein